MSGLVLVADDDDMIREGYRECLEAADYTVVAVPNGEQAVARARQLSPRLILLDVRMPGIGGIEACRRIRAALGSGVPIMFVTSDSQPAVLRECLDAGGNDFYIKDGKIAAILDRVRMWGHPKLRAGMEEKRRRALERVSSYIEGRAPIPLGRTALETVQDELGLADDLIDDWDLSDGDAALSLDDVAGWRPEADAAPTEPPPPAPDPPAPDLEEAARRDRDAADRQAAADRKAAAATQQAAARKAAARQSARDRMRKDTEVSWGETPSAPQPAPRPAPQPDGDSIDWDNGGLFGDDPPMDTDPPGGMTGGDADAAADDDPTPGALPHRPAAPDGEDAFWDMLDNTADDNEVPPEPRRKS